MENTLPVSKKIINIPRTVLDEQIQERLSKIAGVTGDYSNSQIEVKEGVVLLNGQIESQEAVEWIKEVSLKTEGVVAFINKSKIYVPEVSITATSKEISTLTSKTEEMLPYLGASLITLTIFILLAFIVTWIGRNFIFKNLTNQFAKKTMARAIAVPFIAIGLYLAFKVSGLTNLAVTVLGGTGILGLGIGFAMKGIFENILASMILSLRGQFNRGDFIEIEGVVGVIQSISGQGTTLMDYDGNNIFIPNSKFMTSIFKNFTLNPNMRVSFILGIGYEDNISHAQEIILKVLNGLDEVVLKDPPPSVAVKVLASATVNLETHFWINYSTITDKKALSVAQKMVKVALMTEGISMPDDAREIVFANSLTITKSEEKSKATLASEELRANPVAEKIKASELTNDMAGLKQQAQDLNEKLGQDDK